MTFYKSVSTSAMFFIIILIMVSCAINPVSGKKEFMLVSEHDEISMGKQADLDVGQAYGFYESPALSIYINRIGQAISKVTQRPNNEYHFKVLDTPVVNAFAVPGGYVYLTRGILAYMNDEAELVGVIGHELGHENARHIAQQMSRQQVAQLGLGIGTFLSEDFRKYAGMASFGVSMMFLKFSRDDERQADDLGVEYGCKSNYDTYRMASFFQTLERLNPGGSTGGLQDWFFTHPNPANRVAAVNAKTAEWRQQLNQKQYVVKRDVFLKNINGVVYGEDPRQGYVAGNAFYHPKMKFTFPIPNGWQVNNTPSQVQVVSDRQDAVILLMLDNSPSIAQAADKFVQSSNVTVQSTEHLLINGLHAEKVLAQMISGEHILQTMSYFIAKDRSIYALHALAGRDGFSQYAPIFSRALGGFKNLEDPSKINVRPEKITVKTIGRAGNLRTILKQFKMPDSELENLAVMNGMQLTDNLNSKMLIKIVEK